MKSLFINLVLVLIPIISFAQDRVFQEVYVAGNRVNIRTEPNLTCKVVYQRNWGDTFLGAKYNDEWFELIDEDNNILYGFHKYIKFAKKEPAPVVKTEPVVSTPSPQPVVSTPIKANPVPQPKVIEPKPEPVISKPAPAPQPVVEAKPDLPSSEPIVSESYKAAQEQMEKLTSHVQLNEYDEARKVAIYLINNHVDESINSHLGSCILVGEEAFIKFRSLLKEDETRVPELRKLINEIYDPLIINIVRLDIVDYWIAKEEYQRALDLMENIMEHNSENLTLPKHCEKDPNLKAEPQIELKNKYFLVYHLLSKKKKKEILKDLKVLTKAPNPTTSSIAKDIHGKLSGDFWEKN